MRIIEIKALENGAHRNQTGDFTTIPEGWAVVPDELETPNFPFGEVTVKEIDGVPTVTKWVAGEIPKVEPAPAPAPADPQADTDAMLIDHEYRLTLLELGLSE